MVGCCRLRSARTSGGRAAVWPRSSWLSPVQSLLLGLLGTVVCLDMPGPAVAWAIGAGRAAVAADRVGQAGRDYAQVWLDRAWPIGSPLARRRVLRLRLATTGATASGLAVLECVQDGSSECDPSDSDPTHGLARGKGTPAGLEPVTFSAPTCRLTNCANTALPVQLFLQVRCEDRQRSDCNWGAAGREWDG